MNHKRRRAKHQRAGCLLCKPHKDERGNSPERGGVARKLQDKVPNQHDLNAAMDRYELGSGYHPYWDL